MSNLNLPRMTYVNLAKLTRGRIDRVKLAYETTAERIQASNGASWDTFLIRHHGNAIAEIGPDYMTLDNGGWNSRTTADRLQRILKDNDINYSARCCKLTRDAYGPQLAIWRNGKVVRVFDTSVAHFSRTDVNAPYVLQGGDEYL